MKTSLWLPLRSPRLIYKNVPRIKSNVDVSREMTNLKLTGKEFYKVSVRPTVVITTISGKDIPNAAPFSFTSPMASEPPTFGFACNMKHDTWRNIMENGEFVVNFIGEEFGSLIHILEKDFPYEVNEIEKAGLTMKKSKVLRPPRIKEAYAWFECKRVNHLSTWIVGLVLEAEIKDGFLKEVVDVAKAKPLNHVYGEYFVTEMAIRRFKRAT